MIRALLDKYEIHPNKAYGQNFLVNHGILDKIVAAVATTPEGPILEIGAGLGILTRRLAAVGDPVIAVEVDPQLVRLLRNELGSYPNVTVYHADILGFALPPATARYRIIGNIPYHLTAPILGWLLERRTHINTATLTMQREVGERLAAPPGSRTYGILSVLVQAVAEIRRLFLIQPRSFWPAPKVTSCTVQLRFASPSQTTLSDQDFARLRQIVRQAFGKRRKMLRGTLPAELLQTARIDPTRRPESLSVAEFLRLAHASAG